MTRLFEDRPFIIAEVGSNWATLEHCLESIRIAKEAGASAVKFQAFTYEALYGFANAYTPGIVPSYCDIVQWLPTLKAEADRVGIELMCTAFSPELVAAVDPYVEVHKIASSDAAWPQMLEAVKACKKPVLLSTGAKTVAEAVMATHRLAVAVPVVQLLCVAAYPADYVSLDPLINLSGPTKLGFSDHTLGYSSTVEAARCGAMVVEKHFTAFPNLDTPDRPHSLTPKQFKRMVDIIRGREVESEETAMFLRHNRRLVATRDIPAGQVLKYGENYGAYRSLEDDTRGASPFDWEKVEGRVAKGPIARGKGIAVGDVE